MSSVSVTKNGAHGQSTNQDGGIKVLNVIMKLLYYQGLWYDDPEPNLDIYLQYFSPRVAHLLLKYRYLRLPLIFLRNIYPWVLIVVGCCQVVLLYPIGIYVNWDNKASAIGNCYCMILFTLPLTGLMTVFFQKDQFKFVLEELQAMSRTNQLDNDKQKTILNRTGLICFRITKYIHLIIVPLLCLGFFNMTIFYYLPKRVVYAREWFPWDTSASPAFEITLFSRMVESLCILLTANTLVSAIISFFLVLLTLYKILIHKINNIRSLALKRIGELKQTELAGIPREIIPDNGMHCRALFPGCVARRNAIRVVRADFNARRLENLDMLQPLYNGMRNTTKGKCTTKRTSLKQSKYNAGLAYHYARRLDKLHISQPMYSEECSVHRSPAIYSTRNKYTTTRRIGLMQLNPAKNSRVIEYSAFGHVAKGMKERIRATVNELNGITPEELDQEMQYLLKKYIRLHARILSLTRKLGSYMNIFLIFMFLVNTVTLGMTVLLTTASKLESKNQATTMIIIFSSEIMGIFFMHNYLANLITNQSVAVGVAAYNTDWTGASPSFKKSLLIIMSRATVPLQIKPTGLDPLSLKNFTEVTIKAYKMISSMNTFVK